MSSKRVIGIDLGTSNTCAAFADGRIPRVIPTERGSTLLPSIVAFPKVARKGKHHLIGNPAKEQMLLHPEETVYGSKRFVGMPYSSHVVQRLKDRFAYSIVEDSAGFAAFQMDETIRPMTDVSAILLEQIARYAEAHLGGPLDGAVITVPANYPFRQREAVRLAANQAGLDVWRLVNEPTAASLAYGVGRHVEQKVLVFDLGGGTFDVSILEIDDGTYQVLATGGDGFLGGLDFDLRVVDHFLTAFEEKEGIRLTDRTVMQRIMNAAEAAKIDLSLLRNVDVRVPFVAQRRARPVDFQMSFTRDTLNSITSDLVKRALSLVKTALSDSQLDVSEIDEVLLVGGQTRMPAIQQALTDFFGRSPRKGLHPDEVVAQGAAQLARSLGGQNVRLLDVLSVPVGTMQGANQYEILLNRNESLPLSCEVTRTAASNECVFDLFQGFGPSFSEVDYLGSVCIKGTQAGEKVTIDLSLDVDGILTVTRLVDAKVTRLALENRPPAYFPKVQPEKAPTPKPVTTKSGMFRRLFNKE